jgi:hypothetical protein
MIFMPETGENKTEAKVCESCGEAFGCGAKLDGCWCTAFELPDEAADQIKTKFNDCLCPACLAKYAASGPDTI